MIRDHISLQRGVILAALVLLCSGVSRAADIEAITRPNNDVTLSFVRAGTIAEVHVKEGDSVEAGQVLVQQDDRAERAQLEQLEVQAKDETRIRAAEAQLAQKEEDHKKLEELGKQGAVTQWDVAHAKLDVTIAALSLTLAKFEHEQNGRKYQEARLHVERMRILSPIAGKVEKILVEQGEAADSLEPVIRVVKIDPLRIDVPAPRDQAEGLDIGREAFVIFDGDESPTIGKITFIAAEADAASNTLTVRIELPNKNDRRAGEHVKVRFTRTTDERSE